MIFNPAGPFPIKDVDGHILLAMLVRKVPDCPEDKWEIEWIEGPNDGGHAIAVAGFDVGLQVI